MATLTERRKPDRLAMAAHVAALATEQGFSAEVHPEPTLLGQRWPASWTAMRRFC
jgi:hypothetical protein